MKSLSLCFKVCGVLGLLLLGGCGGSISSPEGNQVPIPPPVVPPSGPGGIEELGGFETLAVETQTDDLGLSPARSYRGVFIVHPKTASVARLAPPSSHYSWIQNPVLSSDARYLTVSVGSVTMANEFDSSVWVKDLSSDQWTRVSTTFSGAIPQQDFGKGSEEADRSDSGEWLAFASWATNLLPSGPQTGRQIYLKNLRTQEVERLTRPAGNAALINTVRNLDDFGASPQIAAQAPLVVFSSHAMNLAGGTNDGEWDVYVYDMRDHSLEKVSKSVVGADRRSHAMGPSISSDGRFVLFHTLTNFWTQYDFTPLGQAPAGCPGGTTDPLLDRSHFLCASQQVILKDRQTGSIERISVNAEGEPAACGSMQKPVMAKDASFVVFASSAKNLMGPLEEVNSCWDHQRMQIFLRDRTAGTTSLISQVDGQKLLGPCYRPQISADAKEIAFLCASALLEGDRTPESQWREALFIYHRDSRRTRRVL